VLTTTAPTPVVEGAGVHLRRAFGFGRTHDFDPFLLFDDFRGDDPADYTAGFPWHPHRGIETVTYVLAGTVEHGDSLGNRGAMGPGEVQWMTAGQGIVHQEMPKGDTQGRMHGFQLWVNLPAAQKMTSPRYQHILAEQVPQVVDDCGVSVRVICGRFGQVCGPVQGAAAVPHYYDVELPPDTTASLAVDPGHQAFAYVFGGRGRFGASGSAAPSTAPVGNRTLVRFGAGDAVVAGSTEEGLRFLLAAGAPLREPVAWRGPIVMNTEEELRQAYAQLREGTFIQPR
jgi:redox-sensitive bicupin YhaK (pirin superfamily)